MAGSTKVLIVDDERVIANSLAMILKTWGFDSRAAYSGEDAVEIAVTWTPDVVISDVIMGPMDGVALATYLAEALPTCKVLLISGNIATAPQLERSKDIGFEFPILAKPCHPDSILEFLTESGFTASASHKSEAAHDETSAVPS